jgi:hypothetical protein
MGKVPRIAPVFLILVLSASLLEAPLVLPPHLAHITHAYEPAKAG